jgi:GT2 family glycosyltransferase
VIWFPVIDWKFRFQRPQQLATCFAQRGHRIFYARTTFNVRRPSHARIILSPLRANVFDIQLPAEKKPNIYQERLGNDEVEKILEAFARFREQQDISTAIMIVDLPFWWSLVQRLRERFGWKIIYDCMDHHAGFSTNEAQMLTQEEELSRGADLVLASSSRLEEEQQRLNPNTILVRNAADFEHFRQAATAPDALARRPRPMIGYYGAISDWFDVAAVRQVALARPQWSFVLVGSTAGADVSDLDTLPNVHLLGEKPYAALPGYLNSFDVCLLPFVRNALTEATNPVKFYEFLSAGKPVVARALPELLMQRELAYLTDAPRDYVILIERALREDTLERQAARREFARNNTWEERFAKVTRAVQRTHKKVSIIVITFNNLELTRRTLDSIRDRTSYPNYELIVVDNHSTDGTREYLAALEREERAKIILNPHNAGFARASNQGIAAATGEYFVLMNNDVVVTRSWLTRLLSHLDHPSIGLVGPVTNRIGNEAQIRVGYRQLNDMEKFAGRYTRAHAGKRFEIPMLAMYCVALRRGTYGEIGPLDERFEVGMFEDDDYSYRLRQAGYQIVCAEDVFVHHFGKASFNQLDAPTYARIFETNRLRFEQKWQTTWIRHRARES